MSDTHTREDPKRKRLDCGIDSSDSFVLSEKRIREALSIDSSSSGGGDSLALEDPIAEVSFKTESPAAIQHQGEPLIPLTALLAPRYQQQQYPQTSPAAVNQYPPCHLL